MGTLVVENVVAGYGSGPNILTGLSLTVETCKTYCIIGPNGAGKSTLLKVIAGLLKPREGKITFKGETLNGLRPDQILRLGLCYVPIRPQPVSRYDRERKPAHGWLRAARRAAGRAAHRRSVQPVPGAARKELAVWPKRFPVGSSS